MPTVEIRDSIVGQVTTSELGFGYMTRAIQLKDGFRHSIEAIQMFNDNGGMWLKTTDALEDPNNAGYQLFVSPFPMLRTGMEWGLNAGTSLFPGSGQLAGEDNILYKETGITGIDQNNGQQQNKTWVERFPDHSLGAIPTTNWYTSHIYITLFVWNSPLTTVDVKYSLFAKVKQTKVSAAEESMGQYREFLTSQIQALQSTAVVYSPAKVSGYVFPMWRYGGQRPELMMSSTNILRYYNNVASNANQDMQSRDDLQEGFKKGTTMVAFDQAFGSDGFPDWVTILDVAGVTTGPIRSFAPPLKFADNGNTLMF
tara:strand:- start:13 stop:948 length:936 start_codon:yes stop_codon:yes gene_type:complete